MFDRSTAYYDAFYDATGKDYPAEVAVVEQWIDRTCPDARSLLDVACGTGRHLQLLAERFECVGVDLDADMVAIAADRCPTARFVTADMTTLDLGERFDVVTCLFSSIAYSRTVDVLDRTVAALAGHLRPGGVLIVEPFIQPDEWRTGHTGALFVDRPELKAARITRTTRHDDVAVMTFHYLVADDEVRSFTECHEVGLFRWDQYESAFRSAGLGPTVDREGPMGRGLVVGTTTGGAVG